MSLINSEQMKLSSFEPGPKLKWEKDGDIPAPHEDARSPRRLALPAGGGDSIVPVAIDKHHILLIDRLGGAIHESHVRLFDGSTKEFSNESLPTATESIWLCSLPWKSLRDALEEKTVTAIV